MTKRLMLCIDQGTTSSKTALIGESLKLIHKNTLPQVNIYQKPGWSETNPKQMYSNIKKLCNESINYYNNLTDSKDLVSLGITNQRETCLIWNRVTGEPYCNSIIWNDTRTIDIVNGFLNFNNNDKNEFVQKTGLPISTYFSGFKFKYMIETIPELKNKIRNKDYKDLCFGTIDNWIVFNLTKGKKFVTDVTNASRTMLMNIDTLKWDESMLNAFGIPIECLPDILSSSDDFGVTEDLDKNIPITGVIGDQQSACMGHSLAEHQVKNTYGTGGFLLMNTGKERIFSQHGLLTTVLYKNKKEQALYALEGSIESAGNTITWLRENMMMFDNFEELRDLFLSVDDCGDVYFVPSFSGLYSPYWNTTARGTLQGLTMNTKKGHIVRATFEAVSFRTSDILNSFEEDTDVKIHSLKVDGGMTQSNEFLQTQSNLANCTVSAKEESEITILGAAVTSGLGSGLFNNLDEVRKLMLEYKHFKPNIMNEEREEKHKKWKKAVDRSINWTI